MADKQQNSAVQQETTQKVAVLGLSYPTKSLKGFYDKQVSASQDDLMGTQIRSIKWVIPSTEKGKPNTELLMWNEGKSVTVGGKRVVAPHLEEFTRLVVAHAVAGDTLKGRGYALSIAMNTKTFADDLKKLADRGVIVEAVYDDDKRFYSPFAQLYQYGVIHASFLQDTNKHWPPAVVEGAKAVIDSTTPEVEVEFSL